MKNSLVLTAVLMTIGTPAFAAKQGAQPGDSSQSGRSQELSKRGRLDEYQQLLAITKPSSGSFATVKGSRQALTKADLREAAFNLASLGFTAADVMAYRERGIDLFGAADNLNKAQSTSEEKLLLADTVIVAVAGKSEQGRNRMDGFLSAVPLTVLKSLKGTRAPRDIVYLPQASGRAPDGSIVELTSDVNLTAGNTYLLALSKNWYEQRVAGENKHAEPGFNAMLYIAQEATQNGTLLPTPKASRTGTPLESIKAVEAALKKSSVGQGSKVSKGFAHAN